MPEVVVPTGTIGILTLMVKAGLASSTSEARRLVQAGAVHVNDEKITDFRFEVTPQEGMILKSGKRGFAKVKLEV